jgi:hypothetical protein
MRRLFGLSLAIIVIILCCPVAQAQNDWPYIGGDANGTRYSMLD